MTFVLKRDAIQLLNSRLWSIPFALVIIATNALVFLDLNHLIGQTTGIGIPPTLPRHRAVQQNTPRFLTPIGDADLSTQPRIGITLRGSAGFWLLGGHFPPWGKNTLNLVHIGFAFGLYI